MEPMADKWRSFGWEAREVNGHSVAEIHQALMTPWAKDRPLVAPTKIAGEPTERVLDALKVYEDRTRYRARAELRARPTAEVIPALE